MRYPARVLMTAAFAWSACGRGDKPSPRSRDLVIEGDAKRGTTDLTLTLSARPQDFVMDDITYTRLETVDLVVRANGARVQPKNERCEGTSNGGDVIITLPAIPGATRLSLEGSVVVRDEDGSELERGPVPATVEIAEVIPRP